MVAEFFSRIAGTGSYLPQRVLTNDDLSKIVETTDEWIFSRTGMKERHIAAEGELTSDLGAKAALAALEAARLRPRDIDLLVLATTTPDLTFPATACIVQQKIGARRAAAFDVQAVCSGFVFALSVADGMIRAGSAKKALVVGAETLSRIIDWGDRSTCVLFGDGAGAAVLQATDRKTGVLSSVIKSDGSYCGILKTTGGPSTSADVGKIMMNGQDVFKLAVKKIPEISEAALKRAGLELKDIDWFIPHQANTRIIDAAMKHLDLPPEKVVKTIEVQANTSAASIGISLDMAIRDGRIRRGHKILATAMGGGFTWGSMVIEY
jgi:3-oxoacyl-[acyl-carrier-protein] synthase-3